MTNDADFKITLVYAFWNVRQFCYSSFHFLFVAAPGVEQWRPRPPWQRAWIWIYFRVKRTCFIFFLHMSTLILKIKHNQTTVFFLFLKHSTRLYITLLYRNLNFTFIQVWRTWQDCSCHTGRSATLSKIQLPQNMKPLPVSRRGIFSPLFVWASRHDLPSSTCGNCLPMIASYISLF